MTEGHDDIEVDRVAALFCHPEGSEGSQNGVVSQAMWDCFAQNDVSEG